MKKTYLIFRVHGFLYAIDASVVVENLWLPEVTPVTETPRHIVGVINIRKKIIPIMDLNVRLGYSPIKYATTDSIVILEFSNILIGLIVNEICDVYDIMKEDITSTPSYGEGQQSLFVKNMARIENDIAMLLDHSFLINHITDVSIEEKEDLDIQESETEQLSKETQYFSPQATIQEREIFAKRAQILKQPIIVEEDNTDTISLAVFSLNNEYYGVDVNYVREFCTYSLSKVTPVPCCPQYIIGNINLRGEILTLVDIRSVLQLSTSFKEYAKAIVINMDNFFVGIPVDNVFAVANLDRKNIASTPIAQLENKQYHKGVTHYKDKTLTILDITNILSYLVVEEQV
ncbi:chemotaxis protein CheW [Candidatus Uabimicrobium sp. HlEnr_7]|uniref:chemotaxis protein CheW n=1 Tax=Candidatus Uabimicrobium helgolandensis TaxID=3095367 RepID=UPI0035560DAE